MSLKYEILKKIFRLIRFKKLFGKPQDELIEEARKLNRKSQIPVLKDPDFRFEIIMIDDCPVLIMRHIRKTEKACLFIIGGGMIHKPNETNIRRAFKYARDCGRDLFVPYYPLCTDHPLDVSYRMIHDTYLEMLKEYDHSDISVFGSSSGGNLALGL